MFLMGETLTGFKNSKIVGKFRMGTRLEGMMIVLASSSELVSLLMRDDKH